MTNFLFLALGLLLGAFIAWLYFRAKSSVATVDEALVNQKNELDKKVSGLEANSKSQQIEVERLRKELEVERSNASRINSTLAKTEEALGFQKTRYDEQKVELENMHKKLTTEFENIANKIFDDKGQKLSEQNKLSFEQVINPFKDKIKEFEEKVDKTFKAESEERITLKTEIKNLLDLNKQVSADANNLASALKGNNKTMGNWGEVMLERILEQSGLLKDREYRTQVSVTNTDGKRFQPDVVVDLPDNKHIIIDSKVSLVAYEACVNAETEEDRKVHSKAHLESLRSHVKSLSGKEYQGLEKIDSPEFVLMFIPIESSFGLALKEDAELFGFAWDKKIVIVSPTTLYATLRLIATIWNQERQTKNVLDIAVESGKLYDKFVGFLKDMLEIGDRIGATQKSFNNAMGKLKSGSGNLIGRAEKIRKLGAKTTKLIDQDLIDEPEDIDPDLIDTVS